MARLEPLIKVRKHAVEEKQRALALLYEEQERLLHNKEMLIMDLAREQALIESGTAPLDVQVGFGAYAARMRGQIEGLEKSMARMETRIVVAVDDIRTAFAEMKKIDLTHQARTARVKKEAADKENKLFDDIGTEGHRRKSEQGEG